jgi:F0F1-type ATP synthase alpha subunit
MPVINQVAAIYAGTQGFLDDVAPAKVRDFEIALDAALSSEPAFKALFEKEKAMTPPVKAELERILKRVKDGAA